MNRFRKTVSAAGMIAALGLLAGCAGTAGDAAPTAQASDVDSEDFDWSSAEPVEITVSSIFAPGQTSTQLIEAWMDAVTEATEGIVTFDYYESATLHPAPEGLSAMTSGLTDVTFVHNGYFPDQLPISNWDDMVVRTALSDFGYPDTNVAGIGQQVIHYTDDNVAVPEMREAGFVPLLPMLSGPSALICAQEFSDPESLEGRQVRVADAIVKEEFESLGMTGVFTPPNEQYEALQRGVLDCAVNAVTTVHAADLLSVAPWVSLPFSGPSTGANWVISTTTWDGLIPEIQQVLLDSRYEAMEGFASTTLDEYAELVDAAEEAGGGMIDAADLNPVIAQYWAGRPDPADVAPDGVADPEASIERTKGIAETWRTFAVEELGVPEGTDDILAALAEGSGIVKDWDAWTAALSDQLGAE